MIGERKRLNGVLLVLILAAGCAASGAPEQIEIHNSLSGWIEIKDMNVSRSDSGLLQVYVSARNRVDEDLKGYYEFDWLDAEGREVETGLSRRKRFAAAGTRRFSLMGVAPNEDVTDFRLYIEGRELRR